MMNITQIKSNHWLLLFFVTAFLTMQWTTTHIHLATHHQHNGNHHQHTLETHAHQLASFSAPKATQHADIIDVSPHFSHQAHQAHQVDHANTIDLNVDYNVSKKVPQKTPSDVTRFSTTSLQPYLLYISTHHTLPPLAQHNYLEHSTDHARAPPQKRYFL
ncbi:hypothetical protein MNBD_GAMMA03-2179 [hydrothermal vent metagenome]|uniref:Uncharacterized protein n=1 Tax=hydrothermal vent metagenome TaxID=652676 RepID=A0A3B0WZB2_9ZZZZ